MRTGRLPYGRLSLSSEWTRRARRWAGCSGYDGPVLDQPCMMREVGAWMGFRFADFAGRWAMDPTRQRGCCVLQGYAAACLASWVCTAMAASAPSALSSWLILVLILTRVLYGSATRTTRAELRLATWLVVVTSCSYTTPSRGVADGLIFPIRHLGSLT